jgi:AcrR family transcriptional regulator
MDKPQFIGGIDRCGDPRQNRQIMRSSRPPQKRTQKRRRDILSASLRCFLRHGVDAATIEQIRHGSGASAGSIYHHFGSKQGIAVALYVEGQAELAEVFRKAMEGHESLKEGIAAIIRGYCDWVAQNPDWAMYLLRVATADLSTTDAAAINQINAQIRDDLVQWLRPFVERGEVSDLPEDLYTSVVHGSSSHFARHWLAGRQSLDLPSAVEHLASATWGGLTSGRSVSSAAESERGNGSRRRGRASS